MNMFWKKRAREKRTEALAGPLENGAADSGSGEAVIVRSTTPAEKPVWRAFPGPRRADTPLRVAVERSAYADLIAHAKASLEVEVCGVLAGQVCEDDEGLFVHVEAVIPGTAASSGSTHVTFTQPTWNAIHQALERDHPKLRIVGWYHTHPGFGVEFSDMDLFIQKNFFGGPTQIALVTDPLSGAVAICANKPGGARYLPRFWVDGREQLCRAPERQASVRESPTGTGDLAAGQPASDTAQALQSLESRVAQLVHETDDLRAAQQRFILFVGTLICLAIVAFTAYAIYWQFKARVEPPRNVGFMQVPVPVGDHTVLLGVQVVSWKLPPELDLRQQILLQLRQELEKEAAKLAATNAPPAGSNAPAAGTNAPAAKNAR